MVRGKAQLLREILVILSYSQQFFLAVFAAFLLYLLGRVLYVFLLKNFLVLLITRARQPVETVANRLGISYQAMIFSGAFFLFLYLGGYLDTWLAGIVKVIFAFSLAYFVIEIGNLFLIDFLLVEVQKARISALLRDITKVILYVVVLLALLGTTLKIDIASLITTSAIFSLIIGLALQDTLGNLFAGLSLQIDNPVKVGDWVLINNQEAKVLEINWRGIRLLTRSNDTLVIPNNAVSKADIVNYRLPRLHLCRRKIGTSYGDPPNKVRKILLGICRDTDGVLDDPPPTVHLLEYSDFSINFEIRFFIEDFDHRPAIESAVMNQIWYQFRRNGITIPFPIRTVYLKEEKVRVEERLADLLKILGKVDFLAPLSEDDRRLLAADTLSHLYAHGEVLFRQGEVGDTFYIIKAGTVEVEVADARGKTAVIAKMGSGDFFGEMALLTGEPRSATIRVVEDSEILSLGRESFATLLSANPPVAEAMSRVLAHRLAARQEALEKMEAEYQVGVKEASAAREASLQQKILSGIRAIFGMEW